jgi:hypothetical protein
VTELGGLLRRRATAGVEFIPVGGAAATAHGSARLTQDVDVVYRRAAENIARRVAARRDLPPSLRGAPPGLPFRLDEETLRRGLNFPLTTDPGPLDLLGEIVGGGYEALVPGSIPLEAFGLTCRGLGLEPPIAAKRAAGRPRDLEAVAELEAIREERRGGPEPRQIPSDAGRRGGRRRGPRTGCRTQAYPSGDGSWPAPDPVRRSGRGREAHCARLMVPAHPDRPFRRIPIARSDPA